MGIMDKVGNAANIARWKADQQVRLIKKQNLIHEIETKISQQRSLISEYTLTLYKNGQIENQELINLCSVVTQLFDQIGLLRQEIETIKNEQPPSISLGNGQKQIAYSGLICPTCGEPIQGKFCPVHGVEGVQPDRSAGLFCPVCGIAIEGKYCPKDGSEGVPLP